MSADSLTIYPLPFGQVEFPYGQKLLGYLVLTGDFDSSPFIGSITSAHYRGTETYTIEPLRPKSFEEKFSLIVEINETEKSKTRAELWGSVQRVGGDALPYHAVIHPDRDNTGRDHKGRLEILAQEPGALHDLFDQLAGALLTHIFRLSNLSAEHLPTVCHQEQTFLLDFAQDEANKAAFDAVPGNSPWVVLGRSASHDPSSLFVAIDPQGLYRDDMDYTLVGATAVLQGAFKGKLVIPQDNKATFWAQATYPGIDAGLSEPDFPSHLAEVTQVIRQKMFAS